MSDHGPYSDFSFGINFLQY